MQCLGRDDITSHVYKAHMTPPLLERPTVSPAGVKVGPRHPNVHALTGIYEWN